MFYNQIFCFLISIIIAFAQNSQINWKFNHDKSEAIVSMNQGGGKIKGYRALSRAGKKFYSFKGVRYANVSKRFKPADPMNSWNWTALVDAKNLGSPCAQPQISFNETYFEENCLFLNVYVPASGASNKSVIIENHGGGFNKLSGSQMSPKYFMDEDVILVTFNYRLGAFGFLSLPNSDKYPGNLGLKDIILALKWVQNHIESFGGSKERVTIEGTSIGGTIVALLLMSPAAKGLFQLAIIESSSIIQPKAFIRKTINDLNSLKLHENLGCLPSNITEDIIDCISSKSTKEILHAQRKLDIWKNYNLIFMPVIEEKRAGAFLWEDPIAMLIEGRFNRVPIILTYVTNEGAFAVANTATKIEAQTERQKLDKYLSFALSISPLLDFDSWSYEKQAEIKQSILNKYFTENDLKNFIFSPYNEKLCIFFSDYLYNYGIREFGVILSRFVPVYLGVFTKSSYEKSLIEKVGYSKVEGVGHGDQLQFFFEDIGLGKVILPKYLESYSKVLIQTWTSFVKNGVPKISLNGQNKTVSWPSTEKSFEKNLTWLDLGKIPEELKFIENPYCDRLEFWDKIYKNTRWSCYK